MLKYQWEFYKMKFISKLLALVALMPFAFGSNDTLVAFEKSNSDVLTYARIDDENTEQLFADLADQDATPIYLESNYSSYYFKNLNTNFGNNKYGTCSYVSIGMLLSFYDSYWDDSFIDETYDVKAEFESDRQSLADFDLIPSNVNSPGILFEPNQLVDGLAIDSYYDVIEQYSDTYFQFKLIDLAMSIFGEAKFDGSDSSLGMQQSDVANLLSYYLSKVSNISSDKASVKTFASSDDELIKSQMIEQIVDGTPVILRAKESASNAGHAMIAYDYNENTGEIYVHTGWRDETDNIALTHVALSDLPYDDLLDVTYIQISDSFEHSHALNYHSSYGDNMCACSYIYPREIELTSGNFGDTLPTFEWMSLHNEKWFPAYDLKLEFSILDSNRHSKLSTSRIDANSYSLSQEEWDLIRFDIPGSTYNILVNIDEESGLFGSDDYWCRKSFSKPLEYEYVPYINPDEYGFADAYPSDYDTSITFINHEAHNNGEFQTRRYRTGYIHNEYIVLSPIRKGYNHAFIEYRFNKPINRIDVQLSHWREYSKEQLDSSNGKAEVQAYIDGDWVCQLDLLADSTDLPRNRNQPNTYKIILDEPTYNIRFYAETFTTPTNDSNLGRICIGNLAYYECDGLPTSGYELDYNPSIWQGATMSNNCYGYALNNQVHPGTNTVWYKQQPGEYSKTNDYPFTKEILKNAVTQDFALYNIDFGTKLIFKEVGKYSVVPEGTCKVALVSYSGDYHWYRQDSDGYWSHKPGTTAVRRTDNSGDLILDPETCDRGSYTNFLGFYAVTPWNNLYQA